MLRHTPGKRELRINAWSEVSAMTAAARTDTTTAAPTPAPAPVRISGAALLVKALEAQGVEHVFGYPGGAIMPVYDALPRAKFKHILTRHRGKLTITSRINHGSCFVASVPLDSNRK